MTGDYILSIASIMISRLKNDDVTLILSQVSLKRNYLSEIKKSLRISLSLSHKISHSTGCA